MTPQERLFNALADAGAAFSRRLTKTEWLAVTGAFFEKEFPKGKRKKTSASMMSDEEWIADCESEPSLDGVDIRREIGACQFWCKQKGKKATRARLLNWFRKSERTFVKPMNGASSRKIVVPDVYVEPEGWREKAVKLYGSSIGGALASKQWLDVGTDYRRAILEKLL